jgi:hypothetical protein
MAEVIVRSVGRDLYLTISGRIDEGFEGAAVLPPGLERAHDKAILHLGGVRSLASVAVRKLEQLLLSLRPMQVQLIHVSPVVALHLNLVPELTRHVSVQSARLPFACPKCGAEKLHSVPWRAGAHLKFAPSCGCGAVMALDGLAAHYLPDRDDPRAVES